MKALCRVLALLALLAGLHAAAPVAAQTRFWFTSGGGTFRPEAPVRVGVYASYESDVEAALVPLSVAEVVEIVKTGAYAQVPPALVRDRRAIATVRTRLAAGSQKDGNHEVNFGRQRPGFYAFRLRAGDEFAGARMLSVTTVGIVSADTGGSLSVYAVDLRTMRARHDVSFDRYARSGERRDTVRADADGLAAYGDSKGTDLVFARSDDGALAFAYAPYTITLATEEHAGYIQTDRPIYRPGDRVHYRALVRDGVPGSYTVPGGEVSLTIRDPEWKDVSTTQVRLDAFGAFAGDLPLADDSKLGTYQITVNNSTTFFAVEAYKKPEYVIDVAAPRSVVSGDPGRFGVAARYFFGRPAAGMRLHYRATFSNANAWWRRGSPFRFSGYQPPSSAEVPSVEGDLVADAAGRATIVVPTRVVDDEKRLNVEVDARDATGRTVTAATSTTLTPSSFYLTVVPRRYFVTAGESLDLDVRSIVYDTRKPRPGTPVVVSFARTWYEANEYKHEALPGDTANVTTDANGTATVHWKPPGGGSFTVTATSRDERGRDVSTVGWIWVAAERYARSYAFNDVSVIPQKAAYAPGERASVLVTAPQGDVDALVRVTGGERERIFVRHLSAQTTTLEIEPPSGVPHYRVSVLVPTAQGAQTGTAELMVVPAPHLLHVTIAPQKRKYLPGEIARFAIRVEDGARRGVVAQVGLGVVDDAIFALRRSEGFDPFAAFYGTSGPYRGANSSWTNLDALSTYANLPLKMIGSTQARSASGAFVPSPTTDTYGITVAAVAPPPSFEGLRSDFRDTAYWSPAVTTGQDGRATVAFRWPDSLTSYTASGIAATQGSDFGQGAGAALVTKDFLVRLGAPRFLRRGDAARITGVAQGTPRAKTAQLRFSAPALGVADVTTTALFDRNASANAHWNVRGGELGNPLLRLAGTSGALADGMQVALPVESALSAQHLRAAGKLPADSSVALVLPRGGDAGALRIDLAPSALAQLIADVRLLQVYPYYCVEQTMSAALPAVFVDRMRKRITLPPNEGPEPAQVAKRAVDRLVKLQHADGSWGWWEHDAANPFMTAYALYGLAELAREGYAVPPETLGRGIDNLARQINASAGTLAPWGGTQPGSEWNTRAFMLYALADAKPAAVDRTMLAAADTHAKGMNAYALAVLGLAHVELADRAGAQPILAELLGRVTDEGTSAHWKGAWRSRWMDDPIETTAYALRFVHAMTPGDPRVARAVNWLRAQQHGSWFATTKDTAAAIYAMAEAESVTAEELHPHETIRVTLDGREIKRLRIDAPVLPRDQRSVVLAPSDMRRGGTLRFEREGTGALAWSTDWTQFVATPTASAGDAPFRISRTYSSQRGNDWRIGDQVDVDVTVVATGDTQYVAIEDPMPAGLEYQPRQHESGDDWSGLQFFDDRVLFFADRMWKEHPLHFHYTLRATTAGTFAAPAPNAYAMYGPPSTANGLPATVTIR